MGNPVLYWAAQASLHVSALTCKCVLVVEVPEMLAQAAGKQGELVLSFLADVAGTEAISPNQMQRGIFALHAQMPYNAV